MKVTADADKPMDQWIKNLLWVKVTFNEIIEGIELIQAPTDAQGRHLTYMFYRREAPELKPMAGPQKMMKLISGPGTGTSSPASLSSSGWTTASRNPSIGGPKRRGRCCCATRRCMCCCGRGAVWGVAKIGIDTRPHVPTAHHPERRTDTALRRNIWVEIILSLAISGLFGHEPHLLLGALYHGTPESVLSLVAGDLESAQPEDFDLWLENLRRVDPQGQTEVMVIKQVLERLGMAVPKLGQRLVDGEAGPAWGNYSRWLPASRPGRLKCRPCSRNWAMERPADSLDQTLALMRAETGTAFDDLFHLWSD